MRDTWRYFYGNLIVVTASYCLQVKREPEKYIYFVTDKEEGRHKEEIRSQWKAINKLLERNH